MKCVCVCVKWHKSHGSQQCECVLTPAAYKSSTSVVSTLLERLLRRCGILVGGLGGGTPVHLHAAFVLKSLFLQTRLAVGASLSACFVPFIRGGI